MKLKMLPRSCSLRNLANGRRCKVFLTRWLSSTLSEDITDASQFYEVCDGNPTTHSDDDIGKIYRISSKDVPILTPTFPIHYPEIVKTAAEHPLLIRKPAVKVFKELRKEDSIKKFFLCGGAGSGKSLTLMHVALHCLLKDWVVVFVPDASRFVDSQRRTPLHESQWKEGRFDQPTESIIWLQTFRHMNADFLNELFEFQLGGHVKLYPEHKVSQDYSWGERESTTKGSPLMEVVQQGIGRGMYATDCVGVLLKEIRLNRKSHVMYAIDAFDALFHKTSHRFHRKEVKLGQLSLVHHFTKLLMPEYVLKQGAYVCSLSKSVQFASSKRDETIQGQLTDKVAEKLHDFGVIQIDDYSEDEYLTMMNYYKDRGIISRALSQRILDEVEFISRRNPRAVQKACRIL